MEFTVQVKLAKAPVLYRGGGSNGAAAAASLDFAGDAGRGMAFLEVRMQTRLTAHGIRLLSDETPPDLDSMKLAVMALCAVPVAIGRQRWAVLGDLEGFASDDATDYQAVGRFCREHLMDRLVCVGSMAMHYAAGAIEQGMEEEHVHTFRTPPQAVPFLFETARAGDAMLIKGPEPMDEILEGMATV